MTTTQPQEEKAYSRRISRKTLAGIARGVRDHVVVGHRYRDTTFTAAALATLLHTNSRYLSAALRLHYGTTFTGLVNRLRVDEACRMLGDRESTLSMADISLLAGFATRQSFYNAFARFRHTTPTLFRAEALKADTDLNTNDNEAH